MKLVCAIIGAIIGYLACAFYNVNLDFATWSPDGRFMALTLMAIGAFMGILAEDDSRT